MHTTPLQKETRQVAASTPNNYINNNNNNIIKIIIIDHNYIHQPILKFSCLLVYCVRSIIYIIIVNYNRIICMHV